jgi:hypothetical protein
MTLRNLLLPLVLVPSFAPGCIITKDMQDDESASGDSSSAATAEPDTSPPPPPTGGASTTQTADSDSTTTSADTGGSTTAMTTSGGLEESAGSTTTADDDRQLCESTGGTWDETSCGHYDCGLPPDCEAIVPGCDCGPTMSFAEGLGCVEDPACLSATFPCGDMLECLQATEYCEIFVPGVPGPWSYGCPPLPAACLGDATCACLEGEGVLGAKGDCVEPPGGGVQVTIFAA